jgi:carbamate kinase
VLTHGNGPQVGNLALQQLYGEPHVPAMPLDVCGAMTQGQIGFLIQQALAGVDRRPQRMPDVVSVLTRCVVDGEDPSFRTPTKPIGPFYDASASRGVYVWNGWTMVDGPEGSARRVVPSPLPLEIVEIEAIRALAGAGLLVVACGGGGVPVVRGDDGKLLGVEGVIDKDLTASLLARELGARVLVLLSAVSEVAVNYGAPSARPLADVSAREISVLQSEGHFAPGSMGPKIQAALNFLNGGGEVAIVTAAGLLADALVGRAGTRIWRM